MRVTTITFYTCDICGRRWSKKEHCEACEKSIPEIKPDIKVGDIIEVMTRYNGYEKRIVTQEPFLHRYDYHYKDDNGEICEAEAQSWAGEPIDQMHAWFVKVDRDFKYGKDVGAYTDNVKVHTFVKGYRKE